MFKIPQRIKNRMEKWTAFTLTVIACAWFNARLLKVEGEYKDCMEKRVQEAIKQITNKNIPLYEKNSTTNTISNASILQATAERHANSGSGGRRDPAVAGCLTRDTDHRRRVRGNSWRRWGGYFPTDEA